MSTIDNSTETENSRCLHLELGDGRSGKQYQNVYGISLEGGENVLTIICGDGCTTVCVCTLTKSFHSCSTLCDLMDCIWPGGFSVRGILQTKIL